MYDYSIVRAVPKPGKQEKSKKELIVQGAKARKELVSKKQIKSKAPIKPKLVEKRPKQVKRKKPKKKAEMKAARQGLKAPSRKHRGDFSDKERERINDAFGGARCAECGSPYIEHHHAKFRSGSGRGVFRNGIPLCNEHHGMAHKIRSYADKWREYLQDKYGRYYYMDKWDLWALDLIDHPSDEKFEAFMKAQEEALQ
ncbi:HNH endonuclease [Bacillus paranthracis]|uniref:hypothetical protein n=1 Tax=Bacillus cereus group TaxID=86661 RepID=UPI0009B561C3|nr:hypothetical protein [Bacillus cereus]